jgi:hypothetical protein
MKDFIGRLEVLSAQAQWSKAKPDDFMVVRLGNGLQARELRTWVRAQPQETTLAEIKKHIMAAEALEKEDQAFQAMREDRTRASQAAPGICQHGRATRKSAEERRWRQKEESRTV